MTSFKHTGMTCFEYAGMTI